MMPPPPLTTTCFYITTFKQRDLINVALEYTCTDAETDLKMFIILYYDPRECVVLKAVI